MIIGIISSQLVVLSKISQELKDCYCLGNEEIKIKKLQRFLSNKASFEPNVIYFNNSIENIIGLVLAGIGISTLIKKYVKCFYKKNISIVHLK